MSRGQTPRTPTYFPRMNDRAARRRYRRARQLSRMSVDDVNVFLQSMADVAQAITVSFSGLIDALHDMSESIQGLPRASDYALAPPEEGR